MLQIQQLYKRSQGLSAELARAALSEMHAAFCLSDMAVGQDHVATLHAQSWGPWVQGIAETQSQAKPQCLQGMLSQPERMAWHLCYFSCHDKRGVCGVYSRSVASEPPHAVYAFTKQGMGLPLQQQVHAFTCKVTSNCNPWHKADRNPTIVHVMQHALTLNHKLTVISRSAALLKGTLINGAELVQGRLQLIWEVNRHPWHCHKGLAVV